MEIKKESQIVSRMITFAYKLKTFKFHVRNFIPV